jgi:hypothetical protein
VYNTHVKSKGKILTVHDVTIKINHITTNMFRQKEQGGPPKILKKGAECSLKRNWMTLVLVFSIPLAHPLDPLQRRLGFKVTGFKLALLSLGNFGL